MRQLEWKQGGKQMKKIITESDIDRYAEHLKRCEKSRGTVEKYCRDVKLFFAFLPEDKTVSREQTAAFKAYLQKSRRTVTVNSMIVAVNGFLTYMGWDACRVKLLRLQKKMFREEQRSLSRGEYRKLIDTARLQGKMRLALAMEAICATGIRVSELRYVTVEAVKEARADISLKGKVRTILISGKLRKKLLKYAKEEGIKSGEIFITRRGNSLSRRQLWADMKALCGEADVEMTKVFPHNLRHLFARSFYRVSRDVAKLADILGHSSIETTRIYLISTGEEYRKELEQLQLIS